MNSAVWPQERHRFSPRDDALLAELATRLEHQGWKSKHLSSALFDCRDFTPPFADGPNLGSSLDT